MKSVLITFLCLSIAPLPDAPAFRPREGAVVKRTHTMKGTRELQSLALKVGDDVRPVEGANLHIEQASRIVVKDEYEKCAPGRVTSLARSYLELERSRSERSTDPKGLEKKQDTEETCDLEGKTVRFTWNADEGAYGAKFAGDEAGELEELAGLECDMDYREFLPGEGVEVGAKWERDLADLKVYLKRPGGDLRFHGEKPTRALDERMRAAVWDAMKGKVELQLGPAFEEDGEARQKILFRGTDAVDTGVDAEGDEPGPSRLAMRDEQTFEGELVWDLAAGRARSIEWTTKGTLVLEISLPMQAKDGSDLTLVQSFTFDTEYAYEGSFALE